MSDKPFSIELWQQCADFILPVLIGEPMTSGENTHYWKATAQAGLLDMHWPVGIWRDTFHTVAGLIIQGKPVHVTTISEAMNGTGDPAKLAQWTAMYRDGSTLRGAVFDANVEALKDYGERCQLIARAEQLTSELRGGQQLESTIARAMSHFANAGNDTVKNDSADLNGVEFREYMNVVPESTLVTGIDILDSWLGGIGEGDMLSFAAPMKMRKTSTALNMALNMAIRKRSVSILMFESHKRNVIAQLVSMLSIKFLIANGHYGKRKMDSDGNPVERILPSDLLKLRGRYKSWGKLRVQAVDHAIEAYTALSKHIRIYDRSAENGGLSDCASIYRIAMRDKMLYETDFMIVDHAQRVEAKGNDYEKLIQVAPYVERLARREGIAMCLLAQLNADAADNGTGDHHKSGVRGGTALDEAADYVLISGYRMKDDTGGRYPDNKLMLGLHLSRYGDGGSHKRVLVDIDPNSGLILNHGKGELMQVVSDGW